MPTHGVDRSCFDIVLIASRPRAQCDVDLKTAQTPAQCAQRSLRAWNVGIVEQRIQMIDERHDLRRCTMPCGIHTLQISSGRFVRAPCQSHAYHPFAKAAKHALCRMTMRRTATPEEAEYDETQTHTTTEEHRKSDSCRRYFSQQVGKVACLQFRVVADDPHVPTMFHRFEQIHNVSESRDPIE